jgi:hypothetical protein
MLVVCRQGASIYQLDSAAVVHTGHRSHFAVCAIGILIRDGSNTGGHNFDAGKVDKL